MSVLTALSCCCQVELVNEWTVNWNRSVNQDIILIFTQREQAAPVCNSCTNRAEVCDHCMVVLSHLKDSCTNCHYGSEGAYCSLWLCKYIFYFTIRFIKACWQYSVSTTFNSATSLHHAQHHAVISIFFSSCLSITMFAANHLHAMTHHHWALVNLYEVKVKKKKKYEDSE